MIVNGQDVKRRSWFEKNSKKVMLFVYTVILITIELSFREFYSNPYEKCVVYARLHRANIYNVFNYEQFYPNGKDIIFRTNKNYEIVSGKSIEPLRPHIYFLGGSTTKCIAVQEGKRWPDLIRKYNTHNYGCSGGNIVDSYYNLKYLVRKEIVRNGDTICLMHAGNDIYELYMGPRYDFKPLCIENKTMNQARTYVNVKKKRLKVTKPTASKRFVNETLLPNFYILAFFYDKISLLLDKEVKLIGIVKKKPIPRNPYPNWVKLTKINNKGVFLTDDEFQNFFNGIKPYYKKRKNVLEEILKVCKKNELKLILLTQPNSFLENYKIENGIFLYPIYNDKNATKEQARILIDVINKQTIDFAKSNGLLVIDVDSEFLKYDPNELFIDHVHYNLKGSRVFAEVVNNYLDSLK